MPQHQRIDIIATFHKHFAKQQDGPTVELVPSGSTLRCGRHDEQTSGLIPCLLSTGLSGKLRTNAMLLLTSKSHPEFRCFVRAQSGVFSQLPAGCDVSVLRGIADHARFLGAEPVSEVEIQEVEEKEAILTEVVLFVDERYLSKRDVWHMHLGLVQDGGSLLYVGFNSMVRQIVPTSGIESLAGPDRKPVMCGLVNTDTDLAFRSWSCNMFVLIQISAELLMDSRSGRPYWEILLDCFNDLIEKSLRVPKSQNGYGHYLRMVMFTRIKTQGQRSPTLRRVTTASTEETLRQEYVDYYDVFWEGFASVMPTAQQLVARVRVVCLNLHMQLRGASACPDVDSTATGRQTGGVDWFDIAASDIVEASRGNVLECANIVMDQFDKHYLDRMLQCTGQAIVLLTAGNGLLHVCSKELAELTNRRFLIMRPMCFHMIFLRDPPLHPAPWLQWPGGPTPFDKAPSPTDASPNASPNSFSELPGISRVSSRSFIESQPADSIELKPQPEWIDSTYMPESNFCSCEPRIEMVHESLLHMESKAPFVAGALFLPKWSESQRNVSANEMLPLVSDRGRAQDDTGTVTPNAEDPIDAESPKTPKSFSHGGTKGCVHSAASSSEDNKALGAASEVRPGSARRIAPEHVWDKIRHPRLRSHFKKESTSMAMRTRSDYLVEPALFDYTDADSEIVNMMNDLVGLRLEVVPGAQIQNQKETMSSQLSGMKRSVDVRLKHSRFQSQSQSQSQLSKGLPSVSELHGEKSGVQAAAADESPELGLQTCAMVPQGNLMPPELRSMVVRHPSGFLWRFRPYEDNLSLKTEYPEYRHRAAQGAFGYEPLKHRYKGFYVRRCLVRRDAEAQRESEENQAQLPQGHPPVSISSDLHWVSSRVTFHETRMPDWNMLDQVVSGNRPMPASLPFPVKIDQPGKDDRCDGWRLRNALKQNLFVLIPMNYAEAGRSRSEHSEYFKRSLHHLKGSIAIGTDAFQVLEQETRLASKSTSASYPLGMDAGDMQAQEAAREAAIARFAALKESLEALLFRGGRGAGGPEKLEILVDASNCSYEVRRSSTRVFVRDMGIETAFERSRDWFQLFYDNAFVPPKFFHLALQWIVCSSIHLIHFVNKLRKLAEENGFRLVRLPIAQLFPQPAPPYIWEHEQDRETKFERLALYPRRRLKINLPEDRKERLYADLLRCWLEELSFNFVFSSTMEGFKVNVVAKKDYPEEMQVVDDVYQRLKGWILCDPLGLCIVCLREAHIYWLDNRLCLSMEARDYQKNDARLNRVEATRVRFFALTEAIINAAQERAAIESPELTCSGTPELDSAGSSPIGSPCSSLRKRSGGSVEDFALNVDGDFDDATGGAQQETPLA
eukprot:TRINITY_DN5694_c0_g4_i1.p1 TRINITY_DN5694_c0_g4~~TRINITY_DN5694_c0_g4_i1.p1  ORF type:complete len:1354 (-),score=237.18 TRINITY_DN5694_c0_g4_i1:350-4411(-)